MAGTASWNWRRRLHRRAAHLFIAPTGERLILMLTPLAVVIIMSVPVITVYFLVLLLLFIIDVVLPALTCARSICLKGGGHTRASCRWSHPNFRIETHDIPVVFVRRRVVRRSRHIRQEH